ncbi:hypothetical protein Ddc_14086 [Ditylenchus destructor]|nr:hypothetical protein Ddc_14086 [Ditylenchus destructor]
MTLPIRAFHTTHKRSVVSPIRRGEGDPARRWSSLTLKLGGLMDNENPFKAISRHCFRHISRSPRYTSDPLEQRDHPLYSLRCARLIWLPLMLGQALAFSTSDQMLENRELAAQLWAAS